MRPPWTARSHCSSDCSKPVSTLRTCRRAIAIKPQGWSGYNRLGIVFYRQGQYARSVAPWRVVTRLTPDNSRGHYNLAAALYHLDRFEEAMVSYQRSIEIQPTASAW